MLLLLYRLVTHLGAPVIAFHLRRRARLGKEDPARLGERLGRPSIARPKGPIVWFHAASVGETLAALPLIEALLRVKPALRVLLTTGTVTSAEIVKDRLPDRAFHQFVPVDRGAAWHAFLSYWHPSAGFLVESEIWPNLILKADAFGMPLAVINGRMSKRSFRNWELAERTASRLFGSFALCLARNEEDGARFRHLGARDVRVLGDLKEAAPLLPVDEDELTSWRDTLGGRTVWLAACTHPGEEEIIAGVHRRLKADFNDLLTIIVPRHPERGDALAASMAKIGLKVAQRSRQTDPVLETDIYLGDSVGELGLFYRLVPLVFIGGSLVPHGGQNPLEAARLDCAILFGPHTGNFKHITARLAQQNAATRIQDGDELGDVLGHLMRHDQAVHDMARRAAAVIGDEEALLDRLLAALIPFIAREKKRAQPSPALPPPREPSANPSDARA